MLDWEKSGRRSIARVGKLLVAVRPIRGGGGWLVDEVLGSRFDDMTLYPSLHSAEIAAEAVLFKLAREVISWHARAVTAKKSTATIQTTQVRRRATKKTATVSRMKRALKKVSKIVDDFEKQRKKHMRDVLTQIGSNE